MARVNLRDARIAISISESQGYSRRSQVKKTGFQTRDTFSILPFKCRRS